MNHTARFIDTGYWLAIVHENDQYHARARALSSQVSGPFVTTEAVLLEVGNALSSARLRPSGVQVLMSIRADPNIEVVSLSDSLLDRAIALFASRTDKEWGLVDGVSFVVMRERGIVEALAADQHFVQAGFRALSRE